MFVTDEIAAGWTASGGSAQVQPERRVGERYFAAVLAYQDAANLPQNSHTFAVFARVRCQNFEDLANSGATVESQTISWMPADLKIKVMRFEPEPGRNLSLTETLEFAHAQDLTVTVRGPFPTDKALYQMAAERVAFLNSGRLKYILGDWFARKNGACNCIHAISDLDSTQPLLQSGLVHGDSAGAAVTRHLERWFLPSRNDDISWLRKKLHLQDVLVEP